MQCPVCNRKLNIGDLVLITFAKRYTCPNCKKQSRKDSGIEWLVYGALIVVGWASDKFFEIIKAPSTLGLLGTIILAISAALLIENFLQTLTPDEA